MLLQAGLHRSLGSRLRSWDPEGPRWGDLPRERGVTEEDLGRVMVDGVPADMGEEVTPRTAAFPEAPARAPAAAVEAVPPVEVLEVPAAMAARAEGLVAVAAAVAAVAADPLRK